MKILKDNCLCFKAASVFVRDTYLIHEPNSFVQKSKNSYTHTWIAFRLPPVWKIDLPNEDPRLSLQCPYCSNFVDVGINWRTGNDAERIKSVALRVVVKHTVKHLVGNHQSLDAVSLYNRIFKAINTQPAFVNPDTIDPTLLQEVPYTVVGPI